MRLRYPALGVRSAGFNPTAGRVSPPLTATLLARESRQMQRCDVRSILILASELLASRNNYNMELGLNWSRVYLGTRSSFWPTTFATR